MEIIQSETFRKWVAGLRDHRAQALIAARLLRLVRGIPGDTASVGAGVNELRIHFGPGYRLYYLQHRATLVVLLCGGDKGTQTRDIQAAKRLARLWRTTHD
jgi:putative addiction module killer protein